MIAALALRRSAFVIACCAALVCCAAPATRVLADTPRLAAGDAFPTVDAQSLSGQATRLPDDRKGRPFVAIFGFSRASGDRIALWSHKLHELLPSSVAVYAIADLSHVPGLFRGFAVGGIRKQASPLHPEHDRYVLLLTKSNPWQDIVPKGDGDDAVLVAVDANGTVLDIERTPYADADAARFAALLERAGTPAP